MTAGVLSRQPEVTSLLQTTKYVFIMPRINNVQYFCQEANLPGVSLPELPRPTSVVDLYVPGNKMVYNRFEITFLIDSDLKSWTDIHDWMRKLTTPVANEEYKLLWRRDGVVSDKSLSQYSDGILTVLSNLNNPRFRIKYVNLFPTSLTDIRFKTTESAEDILTATATFRYDYFDIERLPS